MGVDTIKAQREMPEAHEAATLASTGVFLDRSVYFALPSVSQPSFANIETSLSCMKTVRIIRFSVSSPDANFESCVMPGYYLPRRHVSKVERSSWRGYADSGWPLRAWSSLDTTYNQRAWRYCFYCTLALIELIAGLYSLWLQHP